MHRLGGSAAAGPISREERLKKLMGSALYNGEIKAVEEETSKKTSSAVESEDKDADPVGAVPTKTSSVAQPSSVVQKPSSRRYKDGAETTTDDAESRRASAGTTGGPASRVRSPGSAGAAKATAPAPATATDRRAPTNIVGLTSGTRRGPKTMDGVHRNLRGRTENPTQQAIGKELHSLYTNGFGSTVPGGASARTKHMVAAKAKAPAGGTGSASGPSRGSKFVRGDPSSKSADQKVVGGTGSTGTRLGAAE